MSRSGRIVILKPTPFDSGWLTGIRHWWSARRMSYRISDDAITLHHENEVEDIRLADVLDVKTDSTDILLHTADGTRRMRFIRDAAWVAASILEAARSIRHSTLAQTAPEPDNGPSATDRLNDLVGFWQQGLITDEEFEVERRHFS